MSTGHACRALQTTTVTGTSNHAELVSPQPAGFQKLVASVKEVTGVSVGPWAIDATITNRTLANPSGTDYEVWETTLEEGTGSGGSDRVMRNGTIKSSSNSDAAVNWGSGDKDVFITPNFKKGYALLDALSTAGYIKRATAESYSVQAVPIPIADGGTNAITAAAARASLDVIEDVFTTRGDLVRRGASAAERMAVGTTNQVVGFDGTDTLFRTLLAAWMNYSSAIAPLSTGTVEAVLDQIGGFFAAAFFRVSPSGDQAIPSGTLTWAHGFTATVPKLVVLHLKCTTNDGTYSVGDIYYVGSSTTAVSTSSAVGLGIRVDTTNVYIDKITNSADTINIIAKGGGVGHTLDESDWVYNIYAYA